jgi:hypothetical protein
MVYLLVLCHFFILVQYCTVLGCERVRVCGMQERIQEHRWAWSPLPGCPFAQGQCSYQELLKGLSHHHHAALWNRNYFSGSGSDFWKVMVQVRFQLLKIYGSGSSSYFWKVTVPVPVPAPYLDHKKQIFHKKIRIFFLPFYLVSCLTRKKFINFNKFIVKCEWKNVKWRKSNT